MIKKDYIERMVQQISQLLAKLLWNKSLPESLEILDEQYETWLGLGRRELVEIDEANLLETLLAQPGLTTEQLEFLAYLLGEEARVYFAKSDKEKGKSLARKALLLFDYVDEQQAVYTPERLEYMAVLAEIVDGGK